jgi:hypothetical protein
MNSPTAKEMVEAQKMTIDDDLGKPRKITEVSD